MDEAEDLASVEKDFESGDEQMGTIAPAGDDADITPPDNGVIEQA
jgi:hypothetical protein